jgi:methylmalonyl-CoA mutase cobalamin-binding subunit
VVARNLFVFGKYEVDTEELIKAYRANGHDNFWLDIGANIGLTSCLTENGFDRIFYYEPNPLITLNKVKLRV